MLAASDEKMATCAIHPSVVFGEHDPQLIPSIHACIANSQTPFVIGSGFNLWDITYVKNAADAHVLAVENLLSTRSASGEAFFIANDEPVPFRDICLAVWAHFEHHPPFQILIPAHLAILAGYIAETVAWLVGLTTTLTRGSVIDACSIRYCDASKAKDVLGYEPRISIVNGLRLSCEVSQSLHRLYI